MRRSVFISCFLLGLVLLTVLRLTPVSACTVVAARDRSGHVFTINQEDWGGAWAAQKPAQAAMLAIPRRGDQLARIIFSWNGLSIEGGMNEKGLVYDFVALDDSKRLLPDHGKKKYPGPLGEKILAECATVAEAARIYENWEESILGYGAEIVSDASGDAIIVVWDRNANRVEIMDRNSPMFSGNPSIIGLGARYDAVQKATIDTLDMELAVSLAADTLRQATAYTCVYDQVNRIARVFHNHDMGAYADIKVTDDAIPAKRFVWLADLVPTHSVGISVPKSIFPVFSPPEKTLFIIVLSVCLSFTIHAFIPGLRRQVTRASWIVYAVMLMMLFMNLAAMAFFGRLIQFYGLSILHPAAGILPWLLIAASLAVAAAVIIGPRNGKRGPARLAHGLLAAVAAVGTAVFILSRGVVY